MAATKPRVRVAVAFARNFASGLLSNAESIFQQAGTTLTDAEMEIVHLELQRISQRINASVNQDALAQARESA
ncbi:hypothetical protein [Pseudomonas sp. GOM6]|uniref:hypothetical protein n=1 Tax=Pseudomonas sp. GOM6 TaxID=3036944 RepID=UPI00240976C7|nr:hypothetical protein [Pseudomonas sp. GOM6]MDG1580952.1 hypothetical protein [Pseudomonas sp. GOM6]